MVADIVGNETMYRAAVVSGALEGRFWPTAATTWGDPKLSAEIREASSALL